MKKEQRKRIIDRHSDSLKRYGYHPNALYWSNREIQDLRFKVLAEIGIQATDSVLDVGCGFADFNSWIEQQGTPVCYSGIDLSPDLISTAQKRHPSVQLLCGELFDFHFEPKSFDWLILSGAMNEQLHDNGDYARKMIQAMYALCRQGLAFNMLDACYIKAHDLQSVEPLEMVKYCQSLCARVELMDDYLANDFTIYMRR